MKYPRRTLLLTTSLLILLPALAGTLLWSRLPERMPTHFNFQGAADGWSGKPFAVYGLPVFLLAVHLVCVFAVSMDPKRRNVNGKVFALTLWICPVVSLLVGGVMYAAALSVPVDVTAVMLAFTGLMFAAVGNYLPKCRQNYTVGIKLPWTLSDEDNWNRTHRMAGPLWMAGGAVLLLAALTGTARLWLVLGDMLVMSMLPVLYSLLLYRKSRSAP